MAVLEGGSGAQWLEETLRFPPRGAGAGLICAVLTAVGAHRLLPPSTSSTRELLVVGSVGLSLPGRVGLSGFQEPSGILPVACSEKQGADCGPQCAAGWGAGPRRLLPRTKVGAQGAFFLPTRAEVGGRALSRLEGQE